MWLLGAQLDNIFFVEEDTQLIRALKIINVPFKKIYSEAEESPEK